MIVGGAIMKANKIIDFNQRKKERTKKRYTFNFKYLNESNFKEAMIWTSTYVIVFLVLLMMVILKAM